VTALIVSRSHIDAVDRTRINTQRADHALGVVDLESVDPEALAHRVLDLVNVNAIHRTGAGALVAANAGRQIKAMKASITRPDRHRQLRVFKLMCERLSLVGLKEVPKRHVHSLRNGLNCQPDIAKPLAHEPLAATSFKKSSVHRDYMRRARGRKVKQESSLTHRVSVMHTNPKRQRGSITLLTKGRSRGMALSHEARYAMIIVANQP